MERIPVLEVKGLTLSFSRYSGLFRKNNLTVIRDLHLRLHAGEVVAVVGASGSGKSLLAHALLDLLPHNATLGGEVTYCGAPLTKVRMDALRGKEIVLVPQGATYLDPLMRVTPQLCKGSREAVLGEKVNRTLARYGLGEEVGRQYPFQLSGGMTRRVLIASAVLESPRLVIADEPTPGLHPTAARRVLGHFREMAEEGAAVLLITHDLELAAEVADRVAVFYAGMTLEEAPAADFRAEDTLRHPYTRALWRAMPKNGFAVLPGIQPYAAQVTAGCRFRDRCPMVAANCGGEIPYRTVNGGYVRCIREVDHGIEG